MNMKLFDNHNHSQFSFDGKKTSIEESAISAGEKGLAGICFTDHCDLHVPPMKAAFEDLIAEEFDIAAQQAEIMRVRGIVDNLLIFKGIEIGLQKPCREAILKTLDNNEFDQVIASVHYLDDTDPFWGGYYEGKTWKEAYGHYLETIYEEASWLGDKFDIIGHYDYVVRYAPYAQTCMAYRDFPDIFDEIFKLLINGGKSLEFNTKSYQPSASRTVAPDKHVLLRYRELGGEAVSLGSDSHSADKVGNGIAEAAEYLKSLGFRYMAHYENRHRVMTSL